MNAIILSIGDELVSGLTVDTNSAWLSEQLASLGVHASTHITVGDELQRVVAAITQALAALGPRDGIPCDGGLLLITGGLGPTEDDLTRQALAAALGEQLVEDPAALENVERFFKAVNRPMPPTNRVQALRPTSAGILENTNGTAPGLSAAKGPTHIFVMPGVPREMKEMFTRAVLPRLREKLAASGAAASVTQMLKLNTFGMGESVLGEKIRDLMVRGGLELNGARASVGTSVHEGIVSVRIYATGTSTDAEAAIQHIKRQLHERLGALIFGENEDPIEAAIAAILKEQKKTVSTAESCTGGLLATMLTNVAGSSDYFLRGWITYANAAKSEELGVPADLIAQRGAVSEEVARAMAQNARRTARTDLALATTGIAGPGGGSPEKPVGTVWIALADAHTILTRKFIFPGNRQQIRLRAAQMALALLRWHLMGIPSPS